jgi:hypothetical protein
VVLSGKVDINPALAEFRRLGVGESTDEILDDGGEWWFKEFMKATLIALFFALALSWVWFSQCGRS